MPHTSTPSCHTHIPPPRCACYRELGLRNLTVLTADMVDFAPPGGTRFDRVVSVEMFEHMKNYQVWQFLFFFCQ